MSLLKLSLLCHYRKTILNNPGSDIELAEKLQIGFS